MKKEAVLVIIKPDGITKRIIGEILMKFSRANLEIVALKIAKTNKALVEKHYQHIKGTPFFKRTIDYVLGKYHKQKKLLAIIYYGPEAIKKCRKIAGATNPREADPETIRGAYGHVTSNGVYENVVHVSSGKKETEREVKLWFDPADITINLYPTKTRVVEAVKKKVWK